MFFNPLLPLNRFGSGSLLCPRWHENPFLAPFYGASRSLPFVLSVSLSVSISFSISSSTHIPKYPARYDGQQCEEEEPFPPTSAKHRAGSFPFPTLVCLHNLARASSYRCHCGCDLFTYFASMYNKTRTILFFMIFHPRFHISSVAARSRCIASKGMLRYGVRLHCLLCCCCCCCCVVAGPFRPFFH